MEDGEAQNTKFPARATWLGRSGLDSICKCLLGDFCMPGPAEEAAGTNCNPWPPEAQRMPSAPSLIRMSLLSPLLHSAFAGSLGSAAWSGVRRRGLVLAFSVTGPDLWGEKSLRNMSVEGTFKFCSMLSSSFHPTHPHGAKGETRPREKGWARVSQRVSTGARIRPLGP